MPLLFDLQLPLNDPIQVFFIILLIILLAPLLLDKIKVPSVVGLILAGVLVGPHGFHILESTETTLFGTVGLLYIMFFAGLEIDLNDFKKNKNKSIIFGLITFLIPLTIGTITSYFILKYQLRSSILLASMFATHTLIAYPIASRLGINRNEAVTLTVGGTIITDTLALLILAVITGSAKGELNILFWIRLSVLMSLFVTLVLWGFPLIARWFFRNAEKEGVIQYIFTITMVFAAAFLAELAGLEPIIGAFLAGLALNRQIPHTSALMNRIEFVGNALFIPFFLIKVGMLVNPAVILEGPDALIVAATLTIVAISSKWIAAFFTQKIFHFSGTQRNVIFGLSSAHAAATIAIILIAFNLKLLNNDVLNGTIILILITCLVSSFTTDRAGRKLALEEEFKVPEPLDLSEKILVPIANPENMEQLIDLSFMIRDQNNSTPVYPLSIILDDHEAQDNVLIHQKRFEQIIKHASASNQVIQPISRVDINATSGIIRTIKELMITTVVMGWNGKITTRKRLFGGILDNVLDGTDQMILVTKLLIPLSTIKNLVLIVPPNANAESGFGNWVTSIKNLSSQTTGKIIIYGNKKTMANVQKEADKTKPFVELVWKEFNDWDDFLILAREFNPSDLLVLINARQNTVSYHDFLDNIPKYLSKHFQQNSFIVVYPEQKIQD